MIAQILFVLVIFAAIGIVALVLMQQSKGDAGSAFGGGGGGSQSMFGARGAGNFLSRATSVLVTVFFLGSLALAYSYTNLNGGERSLLEEESVLKAVDEKDSGVPSLPGSASGAATGSSSTVPTIEGVNTDGAVGIKPSSVTIDVPTSDVPTIPSAEVNQVEATADAAIEKVVELNDKVEDVVEEVVEGDGIPTVK